MAQPAVPRKPISDHERETLGKRGWESTDSGKASQDHFGLMQERWGGSRFAAL
jgi:hypothetical protein